MKRKLKMLGVAFSALFAISAVGATAAQAIVFSSTVGHTVLKGAQSTAHEFTPSPGAGAVSCTTATFEGTMSAEAEEAVTLTPAYASCKDSLGRTVDVATNGCQYRFHATSEAFPTYEGNADVVCSESKKIELKITSGGSVICTVTIAAQNGVSPITYHDENEEIRASIAATNVKNTTSGGFFNCGVTNGEHTNGTYSGEAVVAGTNTEGAFVGILVGKPRCDPVGKLDGEFKTKAECEATKNEGTGEWKRYPL